MSSVPRPLRVVAISQNESLLHEISWVLEAVGYEVQTSSDAAPTALWRQYANPDFVIFDGREVFEPTAETLAVETENPVCRLFIYDPTKRTDFAAWYASGANDGLRFPLSRGELLARLRAGARYLEFERRLAARSSRSSQPGIHSRQGLLRKLRQLAKDSHATEPGNTVVAIAIDWFDGIVRKRGEVTGRNLVSAVSRAIRRVAGDGAVAAYVGQGRFAVVLAGHTLAAARSVAESLAKDVASRESRPESTLRPTLTMALVPWTAEYDAERFLAEALGSLHVAETCGGDRIVEHGDYSKELAAWREEMAAGNPFNTVVAQDIMEPFAAVFEQGPDQSDLAAALRGRGVSVLPFVDRDGKLIGIVSGDDAAAETQVGVIESLGDLRLAAPETIPHTASFPEIYEAFSSRGCSTLVVTANDEPLGYLTCEGFLSMIDPLASDTFARADAPVDELAYLTVPAFVGEAEASSA